MVLRNSGRVGSRRFSLKGPSSVRYAGGTLLFYAYVTYGIFERQFKYLHGWPADIDIWNSYSIILCLIQSAS